MDPYLLAMLIFPFMFVYAGLIQAWNNYIEKINKQKENNDKIKETS